MFRKLQFLKLLQILLKTYEQQNIIVKNDQEILTIREKKELPNQRVIKADALRTRPQQFDNDLREKLEMILTYYCVKNNITYKQGLNEVAGPFVFFLKTNTTSISTVYNYFQIFMDRFIPTLYNDADFHSLQCYFNLFQLLIKYHDPELYKHLQENFTTPELYATPWFLTLFANKMNLELIYYFWEIYIIENDCHFVFFVSLAILLFNKETLMKIDPAMLPQKLTQLSVETIDDVKQIYQFALQLKSNTPISFSLKIYSMQLFDKQKCQSNPEAFFKEMKDYSQQIENVNVLPLHPLEVLKQQMPEYFSCSNIFCVQNNKLYTGLKEIEQSEQNEYISYFNLSEQMKTSVFQKECDYCKSNIDNRNEIKGFLKDNLILNDLLEIQRDHYKMKKTLAINGRQMKYIIFDLRKQKHTGRINSQQIQGLSSNFMQNQQIIEQICQSYESKKNIVHIVLLSNELKSASLNNKEEENSSAPQQPVDENQFEDQITLMFLESLQKHQFPYVGVIEGGFKLIHSLFKILKLDLIEHNPKLCHFCHKQAPKKITKSKSKNIFERIVDVFAFNDDEEEQEQKGQKNKSNYSSSNQPQRQQQQQNDNIFQIDCRQNSFVANQTAQLQQHFNREETQSNCVENDNDQSQRHIQHSTFQVKHSTPHKSTSPFNPRDSSVLSSQNFAQVSPRPFQSHKQQSQNNSFIGNQPQQQTQQVNIYNNMHNSKMIPPNQINQINNPNYSNILSTQQLQTINTNTQSSVQKQIDCTLDSTTQRNSLTMNSANSSIIGVNGLNRASVVSQGYPTSFNVNLSLVQNGSINLNSSSNVFTQHQTQKQLNDRENSLNKDNQGFSQTGINNTGSTNYSQQSLNNISNQFHNLVNRDQKNESIKNITDRRDTSANSKFNKAQNKPSLSPNSRQTSTNNKNLQQLQVEGQNSSRKNHKSFHQFSNNGSQVQHQNTLKQQQKGITLGAKKNNVLINLKEQFDKFQNQQGLPQKQQSHQSDQNQLSNIHQSIPQQSHSQQLHQQQSNQYQYNTQQLNIQSSNSQNYNSQSSNQQQSNKQQIYYNVTTPTNNHLNSGSTVFSQTQNQNGTSYIKQSQNCTQNLSYQYNNNNTSKVLEQNKKINNNISDLNNNISGISTGQSVQSILNDINKGIQIGSIDIQKNRNDLQSSHSGINNILNDGSKMTPVNAQRSQQNKTPPKNYDTSDLTRQGRLPSHTQTGTLQSRVQQSSSINSNSNRNIRQNRLGQMQANELNNDHSNRDQKQLTQQNKNNTQKSASSNMRFANQENIVQNTSGINFQFTGQSIPSQQDQTQIQIGSQVRTSNKSFHGSNLPVSTSIVSESSQQYNPQIINQNSNSNNTNKSTLSQQQSQCFQKFSASSVQTAVNASIQFAAANVACIQQQQSSQQFINPVNNSINNNNSKSVFSSNEFSSIVPRPSIPQSSNNTPLKRNSQANTSTSIINLNNLNNLSNVSSNQRFGSIGPQQSYQSQGVQQQSQYSQNNSNQLTNNSINLLSQNQSVVSNWQKQEDQILNQSQLSSQQLNSNSSSYNFKNVLQLNQNLTNKNNNRSDNLGVKGIDTVKINNKDNADNLKALKRYKKSGLFKSCIIPAEQQIIFFELFERNKFSYYICERLKDHNANEKDDIPSSQEYKNKDSSQCNIQYKDELNKTQPKSSKSILIVSTEYVITLKHSLALEQKIASIKEDQTRIFNQLMQGQNGSSISNKHEKQFSSTTNVFGQNLKIRSKENTIGIGSSNCYQSTNMPFNDEIKIKSFFLMRTLLKITSKKHDKQMHSFYFKLPQIFTTPESQSKVEYLNFISTFCLGSLYDLIVNRNQAKYTAHITDKSKQADFIECKITIKIQGEDNAADCIKMSQNFFQINKQNGQN